MKLRQRLASTSVFVGVCLAVFIGCRTVQPGSDLLVVRTEQALTTAGATFDFVLRLDNSHRVFWRTNAPAFHGFCEWLRTPLFYNYTNVVPRAVAMQLEVDDLKLAYKSAKSSSNSNALFTALGTLSAAIAQSTSWSNIILAPVSLEQ